MLRTLELLNKSKAIKEYNILDFKQGEDFYFLKIKAILIDQSELHIKEYVSGKSYLYSYHWQDKNGNLRIRWDNAPHHKDIQTFPHHKHTPTVKEFEEARFEDIVKSIEDTLAI